MSKVIQKSEVLNLRNINGQMCGFKLHETALEEFKGQKLAPNIHEI